LVVLSSCNTTKMACICITETRNPTGICPPLV
jgi:hypothetical protein